MCDYSLENFKNEKAVVGEKYILDGRITHGFMKPTGIDIKYITSADLCMACVQPGQKLRLTNIKWAGRVNLPSSMDVTVVNKRSNFAKYKHFGSFNDGIELPEGMEYPYGSQSFNAVTLHLIVYADMEVIPERDLSQVFDLSGDQAPAEKVRELVDND